LFVGIYALVEDGVQVVSLSTIARELRKDGRCELPPGLLEDLKDVSKRYLRFRHQLFGHTGKEFSENARALDEAGFTWDIVSIDLDRLEYAFKVLWHVSSGRPVPMVEHAKSMRFPYAKSVTQTERDAEAFLTDLTTIAEAQYKA